MAGLLDPGDLLPVQAVVVREKHANGAARLDGGVERHVALQVDVTARHADFQDSLLLPVLRVQGRLGAVGGFQVVEPQGAQREICLQRHVVLQDAVADPAGRLVAELRCEGHEAFADLAVEAAGGAAGAVHVHVHPLVEPVARHPFAGPELDVDLIAHGIPGLVGEVGAAVVLLHARVPAVRMGGQPAVGAVEGAIGQQFRALLPARPAVRGVECPEFRVVALGLRIGGRRLIRVVGILGIPTLHGRHDVFDGCDPAVGHGVVLQRVGELAVHGVGGFILEHEEVDERGVQQVPLAVPFHLRHHVGDDRGDPGLEPDVAGQRHEFVGGHAAERVAVDVEHLDGVLDRVLVVQELDRRAVLVLVRHHGLPAGEGLVLVRHAFLDIGLLPRFQARHVLDLVRNHLDVGDDPYALGRTACASRADHERRAPNHPSRSAGCHSSLHR